MMRELDAPANRLSCLLNGNMQLEQYPEPFRMQKGVLFRIAYSEYISYILSLPKESPVILMNDKDYLSTLATTDQPILYRFFLQDVAFAILKELHFAEIYKRDATAILPGDYSSGVCYSLKDFIDLFEFCSQSQTELREKAEARRLLLPEKISNANNALYRAAVVLYNISLSKGNIDEIQLVYDLA